MAKTYLAFKETVSSPEGIKKDSRKSKCMFFKIICIKAQKRRICFVTKVQSFAVDLHQVCTIAAFGPFFNADLLKSFVVLGLLLGNTI